MLEGMCRALLVAALLVLAMENVTAFSVGTMISRRSRTWNAAAVRMMASSAKKSKSRLSKVLNKKTLTVSFDVSVGDELLSKRLRSTGVATIFADASILPMLAAEQQAAKGDFPGPVPVILRDEEITAESMEAAKSAGATGVVLPFNQLGEKSTASLAESASSLGLEALWQVTSQEEYAEAEGAGAQAFLVSEIENSFGVAPAFWDGLAKDRVVVAEVQALQPNFSEIGLGRSLGAAGCKAVLLSGACAGSEDAPRYTDQAFRALRSKASTEFQMSGVIGKATAVGIGNYQSHATKEPTIVKEVIDHPHML